MLKQKLKPLSELLERGGNRLSQLKASSLERDRILELVRAALPPKLSAAVVSAGMAHGRLTIGVSGAHWASRLRYATESLRKYVGDQSGMIVVSVRIRVVQGRPDSPLAWPTNSAVS
jgi:hypothetical protein